MLVKTILKKFAAFIGLIILSGIGIIVSKIAGDLSKSASKPSQQEIEAKVTEVFIKEANEFNKRLPMMVDKNTRVDEATVGPGPRAVYHHTLINYTSKDINANDIQTNLKPEVVQKVCANENMKKSLQYGAIYVYAYSTNDGVEITRFEVDRNICGFPSISP